MHHYFESITNKSGDVLVGYFARVIDPATQNTVALSADNNGTPIVTVSGVENMAKSDENGNLSLYVEPGTYNLEIYAPNATSFILRVPNVAMNSGRGPQGEQGEQGPEGEGLADVMAPGGAALVGFDGRSVDAKLSETVSITDTRFAGGASAGRADNTPAIQAAIDYIAGAGGGTVEVPLGKFDHAAAIIQKAGVRIVGKGYGSRLHSTNTTRTNGIQAAGPDTATRIAGLAIENIRLTSTFDNNGIPTGNAIRWLWVRDSYITNVWTDHWSDSGVSLTDCDRVQGANVTIDTVTQGYDVFNDSHGCTLNGCTMTNIQTYVGLNVEGLAGGSSFKPQDFIGTNIYADRCRTYGINLVNAVRPVLTNWVTTNTIGGSPEGEGSGLYAYGCINASIGPGISSRNAGYGLRLGPTMNDPAVVGVVTIDNAMGSRQYTDGAGTGNAFRIGEAGCKFMEGPAQLVGGVSIMNDMGPLMLSGATPVLLRLMSQSTVNRNVQIVCGNNLDGDLIRFGIDLSTNNGSKVWQVYQDSNADQIFGVQTDSVTGAADNTQSMGRADRRFSTYYGGTGAINTSDERTKQQIGTIPDEWLDAWGDIEWVRFKFNDAVAGKGDAARWHTGVIAQQVRDAFAVRGLDATEIGLLCHDEWAAEPAREAVLDAEGNVTAPAFPGRPAGDLWSVRMSECQAMEAAWQRREIARLKAAMA